jgi:hypothetical protein
MIFVHSLTVGDKIVKVDGLGARAAEVKRRESLALAVKSVACYDQNFDFAVFQV